LLQRTRHETETHRAVAASPAPLADGAAGNFAAVSTARGRTHILHHMNQYRQQVRRLLETFGLDYLLVYGNTYDDRFIKAIAGTPALQQNYIILSPNAEFFTASRYYLLEITRRTDIPILPTDGENFGLIEVLKKIGTSKRIGIIGQFKHADVAALQPAKVVDLTEQAHEFILHKSDQYISSIRKHARITADILSGIRFRPGDTGLSRAQQITRAALERGYTHSFSTCITSGKDLFTTTTVTAGRRRINASDMVCVDMGLRQGIYTTDITRMFFVNHPKARKLFDQIAAVHHEIIATFVSPEKTFRQVIEHYQQRFKGHAEVTAVPEDDFGHGIGFALHEEPIIEKTTRTIGRSTVFTLEPTFFTRFGRMRIEDMVAIDSRGRVSNLTGGKR
jgi:Xaa-Pro aminopeptidase